MKLYGPKHILKKINSEEEQNQFSLLSGGVDIENRRIEVRGDITEQTSSFLFRAITELENSSKEPIEIILSSNGGDVYESLAIFDFLRASKCQIITKASGKIFSGGFIVFLAGDIRQSYPNSSFMFHTARYDNGFSNTKDHEIQVNEAKRVNTQFLDILQSRTKMSRQWWYRNITFTDKFFNVAEAKEYGVLTTIEKSIKKPKTKVVKKKVKNVRKKV